MSELFDDGVPRLCYVEGAYAYFATIPPSRVWGDDWNDAPYQHNAGTPYEWQPYMQEKYGKREYTLHRVEWYGPPRTPEEMQGSWSVEEINAGTIPWLYAPYGCLFAGATIPEFRTFVTRHNGIAQIAERWPPPVENIPSNR